MIVETTWMRDSAGATAHLHRAYRSLLAGGPTLIAECGRKRAKTAQVTNMRIALCQRCEAAERRLAREQVQVDAA